MQATIGAVNLSLKHKTRLTENKEADLVYLIHGRAGNYDVMWTFSRIVGENCNIIAPEAPIAETVEEVNIKGFSWWLKSEGGTLANAVQASVGLRKFMQEAENTYGLKPKRRFAFGFSQGAALISVLIQNEPALVKGAALLAGFVLEVGLKNKTDSLPSVFIAHGTRDEIVSMEMCERGVHYLRSSGFPVEFHTEEIGHKIGVKSMRLLADWYEAF